MQRAIVAVVLVSVASAPAMLPAQLPPKVRAGAHVRLSASPAGAAQEISTVGRVHSVTVDTLVLITEQDHARLAVAVSDLRGLWIRRGGAARGALKGAAIGAAIGVAGALLPEREGEITLGPATAPSLGLLGALIGAPIGAARARTWWEPVPLPVRQSVR
jgi:hypothetical protein